MLRGFCPGTRRVRPVRDLEWSGGACTHVLALTPLRGYGGGLVARFAAPRRRRDNGTLGRSHRTHRPRNAQELQRAGRWPRWHLMPITPDANAIEALNRQLRKAIKTKGHFPNEDRRSQARLPRPAERRPAMDTNPELDDSAARGQNPLRRSRPRHRKLTVTG